MTVHTRAAEESDWAERPPCRQSRNRSEIIKTFVLKGCKNRNSFKRIICLYLIKNLIFYEIIITVFKFTQRAIENRSTCHAWHACRRLPTPGVEYVEMIAVGSTDPTEHVTTSCGKHVKLTRCGS